VADVLTDIAGLPAPGPATGQVAREAEQQATQYLSKGTTAMIAGRMPELVKGAGFVGPGGNKPLDNFTDISNRAAEASIDLRTETWRGFHNKSAVVGSFNQNWLNDFGAMKTAMLQVSPYEYFDGVMENMPGFSEAKAAFAAKSFTAGNLGIGSVYGLTPFNLLAPSRLIYPVYTVD
jgi:hypothetical protein